MLYNRATKYLNNNKPEKAIPLLKKQIKEYPFKEAYLNLGNCYRLLDLNQEAEWAYKLANSPEVPTVDGKYLPAYDLAESNLGLLEYMRGRDDLAIEHYKRALSLNPLHYDAIWNYSNALLRKGCSREEIDWSAAWKMYSYRFKRNNPVPLDRALPLWDGVSRVKKIVVLAEQGMGDKIMFGRFISCLEDYCDEVWVQCPSELDVIFSHWKICRDSSEAADFSDNKFSVPVVDGVPQICGFPICSLASRFGSLETGYMGNGEWLRGKFGSRDLEGTYKIGIVHSGSPTHANNRNRSIPAGYFSGLANHGTLYCLSPNSRVVKGITNLNPKSWLETIEYINGLDLVITIDTSVAHMAGSLGRECWVIQPLRETDFRWGSDKLGEDNVWYPSIRVIRNPGTWEATFRIVDQMLRDRKHT